MKKLMKQLPLALFILSTCHLLAQDLPPVGGGEENRNDATIFELEKFEDVTTVAQSIIDLMNDSSVVYGPSLLELTNFLGKPFIDDVGLPVGNAGCDKPGLRAYTEDSIIKFRFDNLTDGEPSEKGLYIGILDYNHGDILNTYNVYNDQLFGGYELNVECYVVLFGTICNNCDGVTGNLCISKLQIIIIDKDII